VSCLGAAGTSSTQGPPMEEMVILVALATTRICTDAIIDDDWASGWGSSLSDSGGRAMWLHGGITALRTCDGCESGVAIKVLLAVARLG